MTDQETRGTVLCVRYRLPPTVPIAASRTQTGAFVLCRERGTFVAQALPLPGETIKVMGIRLSAMAALWLAPVAIWAQEGCTNAAAYSPCQMVFELPEKDPVAHREPYNTVDLRVEFRSPRRRTLAMPAYWDGGRRLMVRFSPTESGQ